jgi:hypothetical protein
MTSDEHNSYSYALTADPGKPLREAKEIIVSLTEDNEMLNGIIKGLRQMLADVEPSNKVLEKGLNAATEELRQHHELLKLVVDGAARLRLERDEARRQYCRGFTDFCPNPAHDELTLEEAAMEVAKSFGWDCFLQENKS